MSTVNAVEPEDDDRTGAPSPRWRRAALGVPVLAVLSCVMFGLVVPLSDDRSTRQSQQCRWLPLSWDLWALSFGALAAAVAAVTLHLVLRRRARGRRADTWQGGLATGFAVLGWVAVLLGAVAVWMAVSEQADYSAHHRAPVCEGLALPGR